MRLPGPKSSSNPANTAEQLVLKDQVRLVSRVPRGATIRLPATVSDAEAVPAVLAGVSPGGARGIQASAAMRPRHWRSASLSATPLVSIVDVEITGATTVAIEFSGLGAVYDARQRHS